MLSKWTSTSYRPNPRNPGCSPILVSRTDSRALGSWYLREASWTCSLASLVAARVAKINRYKSRGIIGESNQALLKLRDLDALTDLKERAAVQRLVKAENADRERLFREIAAAKNVELSQLPQIRETYAKTLRQTARRGDWIQLPNGDWVQK